MSTNQDATIKFLINHPAIDYLRLATKDVVAYTRLAQSLRTYHTGWRPRKWLQYKGQESKCGIFIGQGSQNGHSHYVMQVSGARAQWFWSTYGEQLSGWYCTRIDLQHTKLRPEGHDIEKAYKRLHGPKQLILGDTGNTLYIGRRTSDTFVRIYDKTDKLLRLEFELKGAQAKRTFAQLIAVPGDGVAGLFNYHLKRSKVPSLYVKHYWANTEYIELPPLEESDDLQGKLDWFKQLDQLVYKLAKDHDTRPQLEAILNRWTEYCAEP